MIIQDAAILDRIRREFDSGKIHEILRKCWKRFLYIRQPRGLVRFSARPIRIYHLLMEGLPSHHKDYVQYLIEEGEISYSEMPSLLLTLLDGRAETMTSPLRFWVEMSMVSGCWILSEIHTPFRAYLVYDLGEGLPEGEGVELLAAWEPPENQLARHHCIVRCYVRYWHDRCFPPEMGECAEGEQPLFMDCLLELLRQQPGLWHVIGGQTPLRLPLSKQRWKFVREVTGLRPERLRELFHEVKVHFDGEESLREWDCTDEWEGYDDEAAEGDLDVMDVIVEAAPFDQETARFLLANYCYFLTLPAGSVRPVDA